MPGILRLPLDGSSRLGVARRAAPSVCVRDCHAGLVTTLTDGGICGGDSQRNLLYRGARLPYYSGSAARPVQTPGCQAMPQAIIDPAELRRFAQNLKKFTDELHSQMGTLHRQLAGLSATWRDQEQKKFSEEFERQIAVLGRFTESANLYIPFLLRKAERAEDYLQQR